MDEQIKDVMTVRYMYCPPPHLPPHAVIAQAILQYLSCYMYPSPPQEVIPILKANMAASCCPSLLDQIKNTVLDLVLKKEKERVRKNVVTCGRYRYMAHCVPLTEP